MKLFRQNLDTINRLLAAMAEDPDRAMKAYALGTISALAEHQGVTAPDGLLEAAASCRTMKQVEKLYADCEGLRYRGVGLRDSGIRDNATPCPVDSDPASDGGAG